MPRCPVCGSRTESRHLVTLPSGLMCRNCSKGDSVMAEAKDKVLLSIEVMEYRRPDDTIDHRLEIKGNVKGMKLNWGFSMDQTRAFFGKASVRRRRKALKSVN